MKITCLSCCFTFSEENIMNVIQLHSREFLKMYTFPLMVQEDLGRGTKDYKSQNPRKCAVTSHLEMAAQTRPEQRQWKGKFLGVSPLNKELQATSDCWEKENWSLLGMSLSIGYPMQSGHP